MKLENLGNDIQLLPTEEIVGEWDTILLTNMRLAVSKKPGRPDSGWEQALLEECLDPELKNAGKLSRKWLGHRLLTIGLGLIGFQMLPFLLFGFNVMKGLPGLIESVYFLISMLTATAGVYLTLGSYLNRPPHTSVLVEVPGAKDLLAIFPGWDSKDARDMVSQYRRLKRSL